jgi:hypothetical protein
MIFRDYKRRGGKDKSVLSTWNGRHKNIEMRSCTRVPCAHTNTLWLRNERPIEQCLILDEVIPTLLAMIWICGTSVYCTLPGKRK